MLLGHVSEHAQHVWDIISSEIKGSHAIALLILSLFASLWMLWRLWRFIITPALHPDDPKELPYWVPSELFPCVPLLLSIMLTSDLQF